MSEEDRAHGSLPASGEISAGARAYGRDDENAHSLVHTHADGTTHAHGPVDRHEHGHAQDESHDPAQVHPHKHPHAYPHDHPHEQEYAHGHRQEDRGGRLPQAASGHDAAQVLGELGITDREARTLALETAVLSKNQGLAERNRGWFAGRGVFALNLMSSPGAGKTTLLERSIRDLGKEIEFSVVEGDQATTRDAQRIRATGVPAIQVNTGTGCHLDADMLGRALQRLDPRPGSVLMIENVGNLVCPALFDLGEAKRIVIFSVTEGEDKPLKYPHMFRAADLLLLSKTDLLPHLRVNLQRMIDAALTVNPQLTVFPLSAYDGQGMDAWYGWLRERSHKRGAPA
jgi:hydrogenase nickel incorporation protein HypB